MAAAEARTRVVVVMNPRSGGGSPARFDLANRVEGMGARVWSTSVDDDAASLARLAVREGAEVLGVAGGDGTISAVAAVAADTDRPLLVLPAGTRNHFARDLGLDIRNPVSSLSALVDGVPTRVDLGLVGSRVFINNVSFGLYADALLEPGYREDKVRALASVTPDYLAGRQCVEADVDTPRGAVHFPQVVLVSNNPYHIATPRYLGRRFTLTSGLLGAIVLKRPTDTPPDLLRHLRSELLRQQPGPGTAGDAASAWRAASITLRGRGRQLDAGIDGEAVTLPLPVTCETWPGGLQVLLPRDRPGIPPEPVLGLQRPPRGP
ncbi:diacylglycerol/lipid kinase family protein [Streptomyces sp. NPDC001739]|uniref:diacylglycerol/lipid kinase family protein n=1 Tax=Streptomyces sp. NPDC001633 TaxID=3364595 RepID=UPI0036A942B5